MRAYGRAGGAVGRRCWADMRTLGRSDGFVGGMSGERGVHGGWNQASKCNMWKPISLVNAKLI